MASVIALACMGLSAPTFAADIIANPNTINTDHGSDYAYGVKETTANASGGVVEIQTDGIIKLVRGGFSWDGDATGNTATVSGGTVNQIVYGAQSVNGNATGNTATVSGGTVNWDIYGGYSKKGNTNNNTATVSGGTVNREVNGGRSSKGNATGNTATVSGGTVAYMVYGGYSDEGKATNNTATVSGGTVKGYVFGGNSNKGNTTNNTATVSDGTANKNVYGGFSSKGNATGNTATVSGGTVNREVNGGRSSKGNATGNTATVSGGTVSSVSGGASWDGDATGNIATVSGGTVKGSGVYGGKSVNGNATNNTVTIKKGSGVNPTFGTNTVLYGGQSSADAKSGNTLNMHTTGIEVKNIANFENLHFYVQDDTNDGDIFLTLTDAADTDIKATNIGVGLEGSDSLLTKGDQVTLIKKNSGILQTDPSLTNNTSGMSGIAALYEFELGKPDAQTLTATVTKVGINPQVKSLSEARLAGVEAVNRGADLANGEGMSNLSQATQNGGVQGFAAMGGGKYKTETGSHIDVNSVNLLVGAGTGLNNGAGKLTLGGFVEFGKGSYDSYNDFVGRPDVHASGDSHYYGVGLMAKQTFNSDWFVSGGLRVGKSKIDYFSADLVDALGNATTFDGKSTYIGANIGAGKTFAIDEKNSLTPYANLLYTHYNDMNQQIAGSTFDFGSVTSLRSQLGVNFRHAISEKSQVYANAAWEHEFRGTAKGRVLNFAMPEPTLKGNSGVIGAGFNLQPNENLHIDLGIQGAFGNRRGASAVGKFMYSF